MSDRTFSRYCIITENNTNNMSYIYIQFFLLQNDFKIMLFRIKCEGVFERNKVSSSEISLYYFCLKPSRFNDEIIQYF